jgi:4-carboxymuconolactone decarboxylase
MTADGTHKQTFENGLRVRREVLGTAHVDKSMAAVSDFSRPIQEFVTEYCWGTVWNDATLDRKTRSLLNIAMLTTLNRNHELGVHVRGALTNGVTATEIQAVLMQTAVYVGVPAALEAFRTAERVIGEVNDHG